MPALTSAMAYPAYAGIPVTHRGLASSFTVVTGQEGEAGIPVDWEAVARVGGTVAVLMGVAKREEIARRLMAGGLPADTPVAAITWGTRPEQRTCRTTLGRLAAEAIESPAVMLIGAVATLDLPWYEDRPLFGRRVIVTRARGGFVAGSPLGAFPAGPGRVLLPRGAVARDALPAGLQRRGWTVDVVEAYRTAVARPAPEALAAATGAQAVTFTSSSTVT